MSRRAAPRIEPRRAADFERELLARARSWIPEWSLEEDDPDFGLALLRIAARFGSEVAERLDQAGDKMALGFLDWLGLQGTAARPARMPVVLKLAETAREPVFAPARVKMQVDALDSTVTFETESELQLIPGTLGAIVAVDPDRDAYYLPPPGLASLDPIEQLPTIWRLKSFAAAKSTLLQLDPGLGLDENMLLAIAGQQYRVVAAAGDLVTIEPPVPAGGFSLGTRVDKVVAFDPFGSARNRQRHLIYLGDSELFSLAASTRIEVSGLPALPDETGWEYWGTDAAILDPADGDARWRPLKPSPGDVAGTLLLTKPEGEMVETKIGEVSARWLRASVTTAIPTEPTDGIRLRINPRDDPEALPPALLPGADRSGLAPLEAMVNSTAAPTTSFFLLGREPRLFDTLYLGSDEAFSKPGATAWVDFVLSDGAFSALAVVNGWALGWLLAGVDASGALHLFSIGATGALSRYGGEEPLRPEGQGDQPVTLTSGGMRPAAWLDGFVLKLAVAAKAEVWVRSEAPPFLGPRGWQSWGTPGPTDSDAPVTGLAALQDGTARSLVALRGGKLYKAAKPGEWSEMALALGPNETVVGLTEAHHELPWLQATRVLAMVEDGVAHTCNLRGVDATGAGQVLLADAARDIKPFGLESIDGTLGAVAVEDSAPRRLWARMGAGPPVTLELDPSFAISDTMIDGHLEGDQLVVFSSALYGTEPVLLSWLPFDPTLTDVVLPAAIMAGSRGPGGPVAIAPSHAFVPGKSSGEIFSAKLGQRRRFVADAPNFKGAVALEPPVPSLGAGDTIVARIGTDLELAGIEGAAPSPGRGASSGSTFYWLDRALDAGTQPRAIGAYRTASVGILGTVTQPTPANGKSTLTMAAAPDAETILVVREEPPNAGSLLHLVEVKPTAGLDATVEPALPFNTGAQVRYWLPVATETGRIHPALRLEAANNDFETGLLATGELLFPGREPHRQLALAFSEDPLHAGRPEWIALGEQWTDQTLPAEFLVDGVVSGWTTALANTASNPELAWEYWNGSGWWRLPLEEEETRHFRNSGLVRFTVPDDLAATEWAGKTSHWIRARLIGGDYGQETVKVVTSPLSNGGSEQTVVRSREGVQPPFALEVRVAYAVDAEQVPRFLLTEDSGTLRDQSDANRSPGAQVEVFTPLSVTLGRLEQGAGQLAVEDGCEPDCDCQAGSAGVSASTGVEATNPSTSGRALWLGLGGKLLGEPVNLLCLVDREQALDASAPLAVDALVGDRLAPVVAADETRALGESGLVRLAMPVEPVQAELFGRTLAWLRLRPAGETSAWTPALKGLHPNGVWAAAAETMTRELLGSSDGRPALTLNLARPPLLADTLELRVREPLGEEERAALRQRDAELVRSDVTDLPGDWVLWRQVPDPRDCGPLERVYALEEASGTIRFGDGLHGMVPPAGIDGIVAFAYRRTEGLGAGGAVAANSVAARSPLNLVTPVESVESVVAADAAAGGLAPETPERVRRFAAPSLRHRGRAVSARDFADLAMQASAEVVQARAFARAGRVRLVVVMRGASPWPSLAQARELRRRLLEVAPPALALPGALTITGPAVRRLGIELALRVANLEGAGSVARAVKGRLLARFDSEHGGREGEGWPLGAAPDADAVAAPLLDLPGLEGIRAVTLLEIDELGGRTPWRGAVGPRELVMLAEGDLRIDFEAVETLR